ncbi:MAG: FAD-dependent oxidoreductase [Verrucomicrobiales bacterium]
MPKKIAIIGAGLSGLAAAHKLSETEAEVTVFEKSENLSGRAASRSKNGCRYDHGANYFKVESNELASFFFEDLPTENLCRIVEDVLPFDAEGRVGKGDPERNASARWSYRGGIDTLGKLMVDSAGLQVRHGTGISRLFQAQMKWRLETDDEETFDDYDGVLLTPPGPQTVELLANSDFDPAPRSGLVREIKKAEYDSQFSFALNFPGEIAMPGNSYALVNDDGRHDIAWLSLENRKADHVPEGESLLIVHMSPDWTARHFDDPHPELVDLVIQAAGDLLDTDLPGLNWSDVQLWRYAHPHSAASFEAIRRASTIGLFFAGDAFIGRGRIAPAIRTALAAAADIAVFAKR